METDKGTGEDEKSKDNLEVEGESDLCQPASESGKVRVSIRKSGKYNGEDQVNTYLLNQMAKHIKYERLGTLARDLNIEKSAYNHIENQEDKIWEVSRKIYVRGPESTFHVPNKMIIRVQQLVLLAQASIG